HAPSVGGAEHRSAVYSSSVITIRLDTAQMAMIRYTFTSTSASSRTAVPADARDDVFRAWPLSTSDTSTVAVAVSGGSPWSFTSTSRRWRGASASSRARVVLTSPLYSPTRNGLRTPSAADCSSYDSHAQRPPRAPSPPRGLHPLRAAPAHSQSCSRRPTQAAAA
uniref:Uncharacterized protein n=1 Tax=Loxodonta africana TaxID=9785 RepID=G3UA58_LOXAF